MPVSAGWGILAGALVTSFVIKACEDKSCCNNRKAKSVNGTGRAASGCVEKNGKLFVFFFFINSGSVVSPASPHGMICGPKKVGVGEAAEVKMKKGCRECWKVETGRCEKN